MTYKSRFEIFIDENFKGKRQFCQAIGCSTSAVSKWIHGKAFPSHEFIKAIWVLTKDEIGPMYWYTEYNTDIRLKCESTKLLRAQRKAKRGCTFKH